MTKHSHATPLAYQSIRSIIFQIFSHKNKSYRSISCPGYIYVDMGSHSAPPMFWAKLQVTGTLKCVTLSTAFYKLQSTHKI